MKLSELRKFFSHETSTIYPQETHRSFLVAVESGNIVQGDVLTISTVFEPEEKRLVFLAPVQTIVGKGRLHLFTEEIPNGRQKLLTVGSISSWKKVGHRSGHWDKLLESHLGSDLSTKTLL